MLTKTTFGDDWYKAVFNDEEVAEIRKMTAQVIDEHEEHMEYEEAMIELPILTERADVPVILEAIKGHMGNEPSLVDDTFGQWMWGIAQAFCVQYIVDDDWAEEEEMTELVRYFGLRMVHLLDFAADGDDDDDEEEDDDE